MAGNPPAVPSVPPLPQPMSVHGPHNHLPGQSVENGCHRNSAIIPDVSLIALPLYRGLTLPHLQSSGIPAYTSTCVNISSIHERACGPSALAGLIGIPLNAASWSPVPAPSLLVPTEALPHQLQLYKVSVSGSGGSTAPSIDNRSAIKACQQPSNRGRHSAP